MALNLDAALRVVAKVSGLNEFKALTDGLGSVKTASNDSRTGLQQLSAESGRLTQEASKATGSVKAQATAIQELQTRTRAGATEMRRMGEETRNLGSATTQLRSQSAGAVDGLTGSTAKAAQSLRNLQQLLQPTDDALARLREEVLAYGAANKQTERSLEQQVQALKNLRSQAELNGQLYNDLTNDMQRLSAASKGLGDSALFGVEGLKKLGAAGQTSSQSIEQQIKSLTRLQSTLAKGGEGYRAIGKEIDLLKQKASTLDLSKGLNLPATVVGSTASGVSGAIANIVKLRQELAKTNTGRVVLTGEGLGAAGLAGAVGSGAAAGLGGMASGLGAASAGLDAFASKAQALPGLLKPLGGLAAGPIADAATGIAKWGTQLGAAQAKLSALAAPFEAIGTAISAIGPEAAAAAGAASLAIASVYGVLSRQADKAQAEAEAAFKGISDDAQTALQNLVRLYDKLPSARLAAQERLRDTNLRRLGESEPGSVEARMNANAVAVAEREISKIKTEQNQLLEQARDRLNAGAEAIKRQTQAARERLEVQRQITAAVKAEQAQYADDRAIQGSIRRYQERLERERARIEREQANLRSRAAEAFPPSAVLALPAAGQTSFRGAMRPDGTGGGALTSLNNIEIAGTRSNVGAAMGGFSPQARAALNEQAEATEKARGALSRLFIEIDKVEAASNGSVSSLQRQRAAWEALRVAVNPAAPAYEKARAKVQQLDEQLKKLTVTQEKASKGRGIGREAVGGALGALATGGGVQAALGSAAGSLAFGGSAAGLAAGGVLTAVGGIGAISSQAGMDAEAAQVRLKALTDQFGEYNQAQAAAATIAKTLRITNTEAQASFANLYASLRPTGITVKELEDALIGFSAAARNSGATAQETSNAMVQLKQGLASGALQGEELRSVREQAPLVAQAIAREFGVMNKDVDVSIGNLKKFASEGQITTEVVLRALSKLRGTELSKLGEQFNTGQQAVTDFQNAVNGLGVEISKLFGPTVIAGLRLLTSLLQGAARNLAEFNKRDKASADARLQASKETMQKFPGFEGNFALSGRSREFFNRRYQELYEQNLAGAKDKPNADQLAAQQQAQRERIAAQEREAREKAKERLAEELKIREEMQKRLADAAEQREEQLREYRLETIKRAKDLERQLSDQRLQIERDIADARTKIQGVLEDRALESERARLAAAGLSTAGIEEARAAKEIFRTYDQQRLENERNAIDSKLALERQLEQFKITVAEGAGKIQEAYAKSVSTILQDAGDKLAAKMQAGAQGAAAILGGATGGGGGGDSYYQPGVGYFSRSSGQFLGQTAPGSGGGGGGLGGGFVSGGNLSSQGRALVEAARKLGVSPIDLATIIGFETAGTYSPSKWGGAGGKYMGLIQFGPNERRAYGANPGQSFEEQVKGPVVRYFQDRFAGVGMSTQGADLLTLYRTVLGGNPKASLSAQDAFGTSPQSGVAMMAPHRLEAIRRFFSNSLITGTPAPIGSARQLIGAPGDTVSRVQAGVDAQGAKVDAAINRSKQIQADLIDQQELAAIQQRYKAITGEMDQQRQSAAEKLRDEKRYGALLAEGIAPETAKLRVELEGMAATERARLEGLQLELEARIAQLPVESELRKELEKQVEKIKERLRLQGQQITETEKDTEEERKRREAREKEEKRAQELKNLYASIGGTLSQGIIGGIDAAIEAAMTGAEGLEDQLKSIASGVLKEIGMALIKFGLNSLLGGIQVGGVPFFKFADGGVMTNAGPIPLKRYAAGGVASSPQMAVYGERGPEAYVPLPDGRSIPVKMKQRSEAINRYRPMGAMGTVTESGDSGAAAATSGIAGANAIDVRYTVERINNVEYVTAEQFQQGMRQAAIQGARQGERQTLRRIQQSATTRKRIGI